MYIYILKWEVEEGSLEVSQDWFSDLYKYMNHSIKMAYTTNLDLSGISIYLSM